jgi:hypothetical protein
MRECTRGFRGNLKEVEGFWREKSSWEAIRERGEKLQERSNMWELLGDRGKRFQEGHNTCTIFL